jgi:hypothetical protein
VAVPDDVVAALEADVAETGVVKVGGQRGVIEPVVAVEALRVERPRRSVLVHPIEVQKPARESAILAGYRCCVYWVRLGRASASRST